MAPAKLPNFIAIAGVVLLGISAHEPARAQAPNMPPVAAATATAVSAVKETPSPKPKSLLFTADEIAKIREALNSFATGGPRDFLEQLVTPVPVNAGPYTYPQFYLESLVYHSPTDWSIWLNNHKLSYETPYDGTVHVMAIDGTHVQLVLELAPADVAHLPPEVPPSDNVLVNKIQRTVTFMLRANQTFSFYAMRVLEGKILPQSAENTTPPVRNNNPKPTSPIRNNR